MKKLLLFVLIVINIQNLNGQNFQNFLEGKLISAITHDQNNVIWVGTQKDGLFKIEGEKVTQITDFNGKKVTDIWCLFVDSKNQLWVGTGKYKSYKGIGAFVLENNNWKHVNQDFPNGLVVGFYEDSQGAMWISTGKGIVKYANNSTQVISTDKMNRYFPRTVKEDAQNNIWITENRGFYKYADGKKEHLEIKPFWFGWDFEFQSDTVWLAMYGGFFRKFYNGKSDLFDIKGTLLEKHYGMPPPGLANDVHIDKNNVIWFTSYSGGNAGILQYKNGQMIQHNPETNGGAFRPRNIHENSKGQIAICMQSYGVAIYDYSSNNWQTYTNTNGIISDEVSRIHIDKNDNIWVGTGQGLTKITP